MTKIVHPYSRQALGMLSVVGVVAREEGERPHSTQMPHTLRVNLSHKTMQHTINANVEYEKRKN